MKKSALFLLSISLAAITMAQPGKTPVKTTTPAPALKTLADSVSYAIGISVANFYKQQGLKNIKTSLVTMAINDIMSGKKPLFDETVSNNVMNAYMSRIQEEKSKPRVDSGRAFLAKNKLRKEVKTTASGLQYEVIVQGTGEKPTSAKDSVTCHYKGMLLNGTVIDDSYSRGEPITFSLSAVIKGWTEGLQLMSVGSKYKLYIPNELAWGAFDYGMIPGGSMVIFDVELLAVKKGQ